MAYSHDLLEQAKHLARRERGRPKQASLRRAVSTAYYALFHHLVEEASRNWKQPELRARLARGFGHGRMKSASNRVRNLRLTDVSAETAEALRTVAREFVNLQEQRHTADYDNGKRWSREETMVAIGAADSAFRAWRVVRSQRAAQEFLLSCLVER